MTKFSPGIIKQGGSLIAGGDALNLFEIIQAQGFDANCAVCFDFAELDCYNPIVDDQTVFDLSGNGNHMFRGGSASAQTSDPTFNGSPGGMTINEFFSFDGNDYFFEAFNQDYAEDFHKDGALWSFVALWRLAHSNNGSSLNPLFSTYTATTVGTNNGNLFIYAHELDDNDNPGQCYLDLRVTDGADNANIANTNGTQAMWTADEDVWTAISLNEPAGAGSLIFRVNQEDHAATATYVSPDTGASNGRYGFGGASSSRMIEGSRLYAWAMFQEALTEPNLDDLYAAIKLQDRFSHFA